MKCVAVAVCMLAVVWCGGASALGPSIEFTGTKVAEGALSLEWGPPLGWRSNGHPCDGAGTEQPELTAFHRGWPAGAIKFTYSFKANVEELKPTEQLQGVMLTQNAATGTFYSVQTLGPWKGGTKGWQSGNATIVKTGEDSSSLILIAITINTIGKPDHAFTQNDDCTSRVFIDAVSVTFDGVEQLDTAGFESGSLSESWANVSGVNKWLTPDCAKDCGCAGKDEGGKETSSSAGKSARPDAPDSVSSASTPDGMTPDRPR